MADDFAKVRERIAQVEYEFHHPPSNEMAWDRIKDEPRCEALVAVYYGRADAVLAALGLEQVGWMVWEDPQDSDSWIDGGPRLRGPHLLPPPPPVHRHPAFALRQHPDLK